MEAALKQLKVLLVEDNPDDAVMVLRRLEQAGFDMQWVRVDTEPEFLAELAKEPDIILSDYAMPDFCGLRAIQLLRESGRDIPLILISGTVGEEIAVEAMRHGATDYLLKDRTVRLPSTVERALKEKQLHIDRKMAEMALRESESRFRQIAENIQEVFWMSDPLTQSILYISPAYESIWGRSCEDLMANSSDWLETVHPEDRPRVAAASAKQSEGGYDQTYRIVKPDGSTRWVQARSFPIRNPQGEVDGIVGTAEDITEHRRLEEKLRQSQKLEAIGTLSGGIAHDFNNILGGIIGYAELTKLNVSNNAEALNHLDALLKGANRAVNLVRQIMTFSRQQDFHRHPIKLEEVAQESIELLRATIPSTIQFEVGLDPAMPPVLADATQVHQIIMNLCTNAAYAMRDRSGTLTIHAETVEVDEVFAQGNGVPAPGLFVCLSVSDTGCGMNAETVQHIFEPFYTTKPPDEGTGLGLSAVHGIMKSHEGAVTVYSQPGEGTVFRLYFPAHELDLGVSGSQAPEVPLGHGEHILFVDDEQPLVFLGGALLKSLGYKVTAGTSAKEMLEILRTNPADFDLVMTDLAMPLMTGVEFAKEALKIRSDLTVVLTTGYASGLTLERAREIGIHDILMKPLSREALGKAMRRILEASTTA